MTAGILPPEHRCDLLLLAERGEWEQARVATAPGAILLVRAGEQGDVLLARGDAGGVLDLLDAEARLRMRTGAPAALWLSAPRDVDVPPRDLDALALAPFSRWDWMATTRAPDLDTLAPLPPGVRIAELSPRADAPAIVEVLRRSNPRSTADPLDEREAAWFGALADDELVGVFGARTEQGGLARGAFSWHLHGLGVLEELRGGGLGGALTAHLAAAGLARGADWVSLGLYAENDGARRLYRRVGFRLEAEMRSYGPASATRPLR